MSTSTVEMSYASNKQYKRILPKCRKRVRRENSSSGCWAFSIFAPLIPSISVWKSLRQVNGTYPCIAHTEFGNAKKYVWRKMFNKFFDARIEWIRSDNLPVETMYFLRAARWIMARGKTRLEYLKSIENSMRRRRSSSIILMLYLVWMKWEDPPHLPLPNATDARSFNQVKSTSVYSSLFGSQEEKILFLVWND